MNAAITTFATKTVAMIVKTTSGFSRNRRGPGCRPWMTSAPSKIASMTLPGIPNAISGIIVIGGMLLTVNRDLDAATWLGFVAVLVAAINCAGGFLVTQRMLKMFRK